jgi:leucyl-tRNA synthetase
MQEGLEAVVLMLAPIVPHVCHKLWSELGYDESINSCRWPDIDKEALKEDALELVVQINGKLRSKINVPVDASREDCEKLAMEDSVVQRHIENKSVKRVIVVPRKLINIVV